MLLKLLEKPLLLCLKLLLVLLLLLGQLLSGLLSCLGRLALRLCSLCRSSSMSLRLLLLLLLLVEALLMQNEHLLTYIGLIPLCLERTQLLRRRCNANLDLIVSLVAL